jgi:hypothetical protein
LVIAIFVFVCTARVGLAVAASLCLDFARAVLAEFSECEPVMPSLMAVHVLPFRRVA